MSSHSRTASQQSYRQPDARGGVSTPLLYLNLLLTLLPTSRQLHLILSCWNAKKAHRTSKQTFNLPRGDANQFTHVKKFLITDILYKILANCLLWLTIFKTPEKQTKATKNQRWFLDGLTNNNRENIYIYKANL